MYKSKNTAWTFLPATINSLSTRNDKIDIFLIPFVDKTLVLVAKVFLVIYEKIETKKYYRMVDHVQEIIGMTAGTKTAVLSSTLI